MSVPFVFKEPEMLCGLVLECAAKPAPVSDHRLGEESELCNPDGANVPSIDRCDSICTEIPLGLLSLLYVMAA